MPKYDPCPDCEFECLYCDVAFSKAITKSNGLEISTANPLVSINNGSGSIYETLEGDYDTADDHTLLNHSPTAQDNPHTDGSAHRSTEEGGLTYHTQGPDIGSQYINCGPQTTQQYIEQHYEFEEASLSLYANPTLPRFGVSHYFGSQHR